MFKKNHHVRIATVLQSLDSEILKSCECYFGGGTAIVLSHDEYRESIDIDFLCSNLSGYKKLRHAITADNNLNAITRNKIHLKLSREIRADQYGVRTMLSVGEAEIKFEIVFEGRISFDPPTEKDQICGIYTLTGIDMAASKLLANSDRWSDQSVYCRDLIDIAMLGLPPEIFKQALLKAKNAYGESVQRDLKKAIHRIKENPDLLDECMDALQIELIPKAILWEKIRSLSKFK